MSQLRPLFVYFRPFLITISIIQIEKSVDGVLGIQTHSHMMVGADDTTELLRPYICLLLTVEKTKIKKKRTIFLKRTVCYSVNFFLGFGVVIGTLNLSIMSLLC